MGYKFHDIFYDITSGFYGFNTTIPISTVYIGSGTPTGDSVPGNGVIDDPQGLTVISSLNPGINLFGALIQAIQTGGAGSDEITAFVSSAHADTSSGTIPLLTSISSFTEYVGTSDVTNIIGNSFVISAISVSGTILECIGTLINTSVLNGIDCDQITGLSVEVNASVGTFDIINILSLNANIFGSPTVTTGITGIRLEPFLISGTIPQFTGLSIDATNVSATDIIGIFVSETAINFLQGPTSIGNTMIEPEAQLSVYQDDLGDQVLSLTSEGGSLSDPALIVEQNVINTIDAVPDTLHAVSMMADESMMIEARIVARRTGGTSGSDGDSAAYVIRGLFKTTGSSVLASQTGLTHKITVIEDQSSWDADFSVSGADINVIVTGAADNTIVWSGTIIIQITS
jgi:hypothetical protein